MRSDAAAVYPHNVPISCSHSYDLVDDLTGMPFQGFPTGGGLFHGLRIGSECARTAYVDTGYAFFSDAEPPLAICICHVFS